MRRWQRWGAIVTGAWLLNVALVLYVEPGEWRVPVALIAVTCAQNWAILYLLRGFLDKL